MLQEQILKAIEKCKKMEWITVNENLTDEALAAVFVEIMKEMTVKEFMDIFSPKW